MNTWPNAVLTNKGRALMAKLTQGNTLNITKAYTGSGFVDPELLDQQLAVTNKKQTIKLHPASYPESGKCAITVALSNEGLYTGYTALQVGIYATDPDEGEILLLIAQAADAESGTIVPSETEMPGFSSDWTFYLQYGQADGVNVTVDPAGAVSREEMEGYVSNYVPNNAVVYKLLKAAMPTNSQWHSIAYGNGVFVAVGYGVMAYSEDGINWTEDTFSEKNKLWSGVTFGNGIFIAVSEDSGPRPSTIAYGIARTNPGTGKRNIYWQLASNPVSTNWSSVTYGDGKFVVVSKDGGYSACSTDGISWEIGELPYAGSWISVAYGNGVFVAVGNGVMAYSEDGINWTSGSQRWDFASVAFGNGMFAAVSRGAPGGGLAIKYSTDGIDWSHVSRAPYHYCYSSVAFGGGMFVALQDDSSGNPRDKASISTDGINWEETTLPVAAYWKALGFGNGVFIAISTIINIGTPSQKGEGGIVIYTDNGSFWKEGPSHIEQGEKIITPEHIGAAPAGHTHTPERIGAAPAYSYGTEDLEAGVSELKTGTLYFVYE